MLGIYYNEFSDPCSKLWMRNILRKTYILSMGAVACCYRVSVEPDFILGTTN